MKTLVVAVGGGGDALGAMIVRELVAAAQSPLLVATYAWERLRIDPVPGPRGHAGFVGLEPVDGVALEIESTTDTVPSGRSSLPRLVQETDARLFLLDPTAGARGVRAQIWHLCRALDVRRVVAVDIGGDAVGQADDPGLASPLADALTLAACAGLPMAADLVVAGPGLDGELPADLVRTRLRDLGAELLGHVPAEAVESLSGVLQWHPTEASALLAAATLGVTGTVEMRRPGILVPVDARSPEVYRVDVRQVFSTHQMASALVDTTSLNDVEDMVRSLGFSEIDYERRKVRRPPADSAPVDADDLRGRAATYASEATKRGADLVTVRRLAEALAVPAERTTWMLDLLARGRPASSLVRFSDLLDGRHARPDGSGGRSSPPRCGARGKDEATST